MSIIDELLNDKGGEWTHALVDQAGFSRDQAERFAPEAIGQVAQAVGSGGVDLGSLLGSGSVSSLLSQIDLGSLAAKAGVDESLARAGLEKLAPILLAALGDKAGGAEGILSLLGGGGTGGLGALAGKLLGR